MKIHIITIGKPKLAYAKLGWDEYSNRLQHFHNVRITHIADKQNDTSHIVSSAGSSYKVALVIDGPQFSSPSLAKFLQQKELSGREVSFIIGGPHGLPAEVIDACDMQWGFSRLTFPHDLAMLILSEALYRASTINKGLPYHK